MISCRFCGIHGIEFITFPHFIAISGPGTSGLSFTEGDALIVALALIAYQKQPPFLELASIFFQFAPACITMGQRSAHSTKGPHCSALITIATITRIPSDNLIFLRLESVWHNLNEFMKT